MKTLDAVQRRALRAKAHHLDPVVSIGNHGLTPAVLHEIDVNLLAHELIKLRVHSDDREQRDELLTRICEGLDAAPVQHLGKVLIIYRERQEEEAPAPKAAGPRRPPPKSSTRKPTTPKSSTAKRPTTKSPGAKLATVKRARRRLG